MKTRHLLIACAATLCATALLSQTLPSTLPSKGPRRFSLAPSGGPGETWVFHLGGKTYRAKLTQQDIDEGPEWRPSMALPLSLVKAEEIARAELHKLVPDDSGWDVTDLHLKRLRGSEQPKWYYAVGLAPAARNTATPPDSFFVLVALSGKAGTVELDNSPR